MRLKSSISSVAGIRVFHRDGDPTNMANAFAPMRCASVGAVANEPCILVCAPMYFIFT